ncbi:MAG: D-alanyl-D-alanine carboxypeptidase, partial [Sphingomonadaceae bacterium]|nr:D-alanyl-D-alanine carboxypeptidase [Sphingomonadaceae bacterium]
RWSGPGGGSTMFLSAGERVSVEDLLYGIVTVSGNDASVVLAECISGTEAAFAALMNRKAEDLGLNDSNFGNSTGWPDEGRTYTTARDLARLAVSTIRRYPEMYAQFYGRREFTWGETNSGQPITQSNRNPLLGQIRGADGLKTGHTEEAGFCFTGSAERDGRRLVMVVAGLDSYEGRTAESRRFVEWGFNAWELEQLLAQGARIGTAQVQLGGASEVNLVAPRNLAISVPRASDGNRRYSIVYEGPIRAPIAEGQIVAHLVVRSPGLPTQRLPLAAETSVGERRFFGRLWAGFKSLFV